jgi:two-component system, OmpR family, heavy metal sensor histidine kinase CusS
MSLKSAEGTTASSQPPTSNPKTWSLATWLTAWYALTSLLLVCTAVAVLYWGLQNSLTDEEDDYLGLRIQVIRSLLREHPDDSAGLKWVVESMPLGPRSPRNFARILDKSGQTFAEAPGMDAFLPPELFPPPAEGTSESSLGLDVVSPQGRTFRVRSAYAQVGTSSTDLRIIQVSKDRTEDWELLADIRRVLVAVLGGTVLLSALVGQYIARRGTRTIKVMGESARRIKNTTLYERIDLAGLPSELAELAVSFNAMLDHLQESFTRLSQFSADLAHELRTPLNNLRGEAEVALGLERSNEEYREILKSSLEEYGRLSRFVYSLLFLARAESPESQLEKSRVNVNEEIEKIREFYYASADEKKIALVTNCPQSLFVEVDRVLFQRALANLVENALTHTPLGGEVRLAASQEGSEVRIDVVDTGAGISPEHLPHVFDRFYRADRGRTGKVARVGLGLAIVKSAARMQGGSAEIASQVGKGTKVTLRFPAGAES